MLIGSSCRAQFRGLALLRVAQTQTQFQIQLQTRRYYGRIIRTIVSKHVASISDLLRFPIPSTFDLSVQESKNESITKPPTSPINKHSNSHSPCSSSSSSYSSLSSSAAHSPVELEDDIPTTESQTGLNAETNVQTQVRKLMRKVPHPVAIITSTDPNSAQNSAFRGMTVSSFNTVTLSPKPVVSFNVKTPSETYNAIVSSSRFLVHLLSPNAVTAKLAREFSKGHENVLLDGGNESLFRFTSPRSAESLPSIRTGEPPRLVIRSEQGARQQPSDDGDVDVGAVVPHFPFILECRYIPQSVKVGDHVVVLGSVVNIIRDANAIASTNAEGVAAPDSVHSGRDLCLSYADTRFWGMGNPISPDEDTRS